MRIRWRVKSQSTAQDQLERDQEKEKSKLCRGVGPAKLFMRTQGISLGESTREATLSSSDDVIPHGRRIVASTVGSRRTPRAGKKFKFRAKGGTCCLKARVSSMEKSKATGCLRLNADLETSYTSLANYDNSMFPPQLHVIGYRCPHRPRTSPSNRRTGASSVMQTMTVNHNDPLTLSPTCDPTCEPSSKNQHDNQHDNQHNNQHDSQYDNQYDEPHEISPEPSCKRRCRTADAGVETQTSLNMIKGTMQTLSQARPNNCNEASHQCSIGVVVNGPVDECGRGRMPSLQEIIAQKQKEQLNLAMRLSRQDICSLDGLVQCRGAVLHERNSSGCRRPAPTLFFMTQPNGHSQYRTTQRPARPRPELGRFGKTSPTAVARHPHIPIQLSVTIDSTVTAIGCFKDSLRLPLPSPWE